VHTRPLGAFTAKRLTQSPLDLFVIGDNTSQKEHEWPLAHTMWTDYYLGHRLRVTVASAGFPKYDRNLNTGGDNERETKYVAARQRILHDNAHRSVVRLPVIPR